MIQQIIKNNELVNPISREMKGLREYFPQCFNNEGMFDIDKFREAIKQQINVISPSCNNGKELIKVAFPFLVSDR